MDKVNVACKALHRAHGSGTLARIGVSRSLNDLTYNGRAKEVFGETYSRKKCLAPFPRATGATVTRPSFPSHLALQGRHHESRQQSA